MFVSFSLNCLLQLTCNFCSLASLGLPPPSVRTESLSRHDVPILLLNTFVVQVVLCRLAMKQVCHNKLGSECTLSFLPFLSLSMSISFFPHIILFGIHTPFPTELIIRLAFFLSTLPFNVTVYVLEVSRYILEITLFSSI